MINSIIIEDNQDHSNDLVDLCNIIDEKINVLSIASNVADGYKVINKHKPDLIFLDIDLDFGKSGFDLLTMFDRINFAVIFTTRYNDSNNMLRAIRASALDYLIKPILLDELKSSIRKFVDSKENIIRLVRTLKMNLEVENEDDEEICIPSKTDVVKIKRGNIIHCESDNTYTNFFLAKEVYKSFRHTSTSPMWHWEDVLQDSDICRIHKQHMANLKYVERYKPHGNGGILKMKNGIILPVSRGKKDYVKKRWDEYRKSH